MFSTIFKIIVVLLTLLQPLHFQLTPQPLLIIRYRMSSPLTLQHSLTQIRTHLSQYVKLQTIKCTNNEPCDRIQIQKSSQQGLLQVLSLQTSPTRLLRITMEHILRQTPQVETKQVNGRTAEVLKDALLQMKVHNSVGHLKQIQKLAEQGDWQRAKVLNQNRLVQARTAKKNISQGQKKIEMQRKNSSGSKSQQKLQQGTKEDNINYLQWYILYFILIFGLVAGMKLMHQYSMTEQAQGQEKVSSSEETQKLTNTQ